MERAAEAVTWSRGLQDLPGIHAPDAVGDIAGDTHLVGDAHHRHAVLGETAHDGEIIATNAATCAIFSALAAVLDRYPHVLVMTDDIDEQIRFDGRTTPHLLAVAPRWRVRW